MNALPALLVTLISAVFACLVFVQWRRAQKQSTFYWTISLVFSTVASFAYCLVLWTSPHKALYFRTYYIFGALWMPALMGLGSLGLVFGRTVIRVCAALIALLGLVGTGFLITAPVDLTALQDVHGGPGVGVIQIGVWLPVLIVLNSFGALAVFGVALWSIVSTARRRHSRRFLIGNLALACGIGVISSAGSAARLGAPALFWITMLVGWVLTFLGYRWLSPAKAPEQPL